MSTELQKDIADIFREGTQIDQALQVAVQEAILRHKQLGQPIPLWRDGKTVMVTAEELEERLDAVRNSDLKTT